ncbi:hypothetical protein LUZ61_002783 [Rhynchospora tenuis]|uniref:Uncharacterized protein n=1 Tax=Rhynchospora tenuis TaxID=198213 RepID=A0AAD5ZJL0_9POAL|nr:hypothetical protein LUZ61_002783 [Rhynchospora tenuis]
MEKASIRSTFLSPPLRLHSIPLPPHLSLTSIHRLPILKAIKAHSFHSFGEQTRASKRLSSWDDKPYDWAPGGRRYYLDEQDVVSFLQHRSRLIPFEASSFNSATYLWKKIEDIPEERRHNLLRSVKSSLITKAWEVAGMRYQDAKLAKKSGSQFLSNPKSSGKTEEWLCRTSYGPALVPWLDSFKQTFFRAKDGETYGRITLGSLLPFGLANIYKSPLYFKVKEVAEVMATEQPCDLAYEFGDGNYNPLIFPDGFPIPEEHKWPFNDQLVIYIRHAGPGIMVAQAWQEGRSLEQVPKKFCGEILMIKDYFTTSNDRHRIP